MEKLLTPRAKSALLTKDKIFNVATKLFIKKGYDNVTIAEITKASGTAKGTFYVHFASKHAILQEAFHRADEHYEEINHQIPPDVATFEKILILLKSFCSYSQESIGLESLQIIYATDTLSREKDAILINENRYIYTAINKILLDGVQKGELIEAFDTWQCTLQIMRFFRGLILDWCISHAAFDLVEECDRYFKNIFIFIASVACQD